MVKTIFCKLKDDKRIDTGRIYIMKNDKDKKEVTKTENKERKLTEEAVHILSNVIITTVSVAALVISIATGSKFKRRS